MENLVRKIITKTYDEKGNLKEEIIEEVYKEQEIICVPQPTIYPQDWGNPTWTCNCSTDKDK